MAKRAKVLSSLSGIETEDGSSSKTEFLNMSGV